MCSDSELFDAAPLCSFGANGDAEGELKYLRHCRHQKSSMCAVATEWILLTVLLGE